MEERYSSCAEAADRDTLGNIVCACHVVHILTRLQCVATESILQLLVMTLLLLELNSLPSKTIITCLYSVIAQKSLSIFYEASTP